MVSPTATARQRWKPRLLQRRLRLLHPSRLRRRGVTWRRCCGGRRPRTGR
uniref:Uncharacterized protein n=1 Tax=Arundo donax TaxID=35708 RepID=A0A0A9G8L2_ARUDO